MIRSSGLRVLFIDDSEDFTLVCKIILETTSYLIDSATTGEKGIIQFLTFKPHVIFLDMRLPDMDGFEVAAKILSLIPDDQEKPIIYAFSGYDINYFGDRLAQSGFKGCIRKVMDLEDLRKKLSAALEYVSVSIEQIRRSKPMRLMLVEDCPSDAYLFKLLLKEANFPHEIVQALDGEEATKYVLEEVKFGKSPVPDIIFLDLNLPKKNGKQVLFEFKAEETVKEIPVIVLTTSNNPDDIRECYSLHANCFLTKPADLGEFRTIVSLLDQFWFKCVRLPKPIFS